VRHDTGLPPRAAENRGRPFLFPPELFGDTLRSIIQIPTRVDSLGRASWAYQLLPGWRNFRGRGEQIVDESSVFSDLGVSKARKTIPTVYNPSRTGIPTHDDDLSDVRPDGIR